jgi:hypothetical protein
VPPPVAPLVARAALSRMRLAPAAFPAFLTGPSARATSRRPRPRGTVVSFTANRAATVTYRVTQRRPGRRVGRRCVAPTRANRGRRACTRVVTLPGAFTRAARAGDNRFRFTGRLGGRALAPGAYQLAATPRAGGVAGLTTRTSFRIVR